ncbi:MAG: hypothetical protein PVF58_18155 [Candidatus Methanofastidiosia archaeon]|jgi:hypothetical protein
MKILDSIITDIRNGENIDVYLTIVICAFVSILGFLRVVEYPIITAAILMVLILLSYETLKTRKALSGIEYSQGAQAFLKDRHALKPIPERIAGAHDIRFCGISLINILQQYGDHLREEVLNGGGVHIQLLVIDPDCKEAVEVAARCTDREPDQIKREIEMSISIIKGRVNKGVNKGVIELGLMKIAPSYSMVLVDPKRSRGKILVEFIGYSPDPTKRPHIMLTRQVDCPWYDYFLKQYENLWHRNTISKI